MAARRKLEALKAKVRAAAEFTAGKVSRVTTEKELPAEKQQRVKIAFKSKVGNSRTMGQGRRG